MNASAAHPPETPLAWLQQGPFTLALSAGFFGFFAHTGFLAALEEVGLRPQRIAGTSAGALSGGLWAAGYDAQALSAINARTTRQDFWDWGHLLPGWLPGRRLQAYLHNLLAAKGVVRVEDCSTPFAAVAFDLLRLRSKHFVTGPMARAIRASAALPGLFRPVRLGAGLYCDGGVLDRGAHGPLGLGERTLLHHIPSAAFVHRLTNPGVLPDGPQRRTLVAEAAPRIDPRSLQGGREVEQRAYLHTRRWLHAPLAPA